MGACCSVCETIPPVLPEKSIYTSLPVLSSKLFFDVVSVGGGVSSATTRSILYRMTLLHRIQHMIEFDVVNKTKTNISILVQPQRYDAISESNRSNYQYLTERYREFLAQGTKQYIAYINAFLVYFSFVKPTSAYAFQRGNLYYNYQNITLPKCIYLFISSTAFLPSVSVIQQEEKKSATDKTDKTDKDKEKDKDNAFRMEEGIYTAIIQRACGFNEDENNMNQLRLLELIIPSSQAGGEFDAFVCFTSNFRQITMCSNGQIWGGLILWEETFFAEYLLQYQSIKQWIPLQELWKLVCEYVIIARQSI